MSDYTPTRAELSNAWAAHRGKGFDENNLGSFHDEFDRWLDTHDTAVAAAERERVSSLLTADAEKWQATADRLFDEDSHVDATRYQHYAIARKGAARELAANFPSAQVAFGGTQ